MKDPRPYLIQRAPLVGLSALLGALSTWSSHRAPTDDIEGLRATLRDSADLDVGTLAWEPSRGVIFDLLVGRPLLFEGSPERTPGVPRDIFRAAVRVSPEGKVLDVNSVHNLTGTRRANEYGLGARDSMAWFASQVDGGSGSISFLDLHGEHTTRGSLVQSVQLGLSRFLETGSWRGLGRTDLFGDGRDVSVNVGEKVTLTAGTDTVQLDPSELFSTARTDASSPLHLETREREPSAWLHWAANTGRHIFGSGVIAWAEGRAFSLWDNLHQAGYSVTSGGAPPPPLPAPIPIKETETQEPTWPPPAINIPGRGSGAEGTWRPVENELIPQEREPLFFRTVIHPDPARPYSELHLVAMDMRRLELGMGAGYEDPHPDTGPPGSGQLPTEGDLATRVVATFNGAFKAVHGQYGMKAEGRLLVEPVVGAATVRIDHAGSAGFGTWEAGDSADDIVAFRQNLDPLVDQGTVNPAKREVWGDHLYGSGVAVERSALCLHSSGHLLYGWATEATGETLASGMAAAGCLYAIHLDMNPGHCAFLFNRVESIKPLKARGKPLDARMRVNPTRFIRWSPKDFFYVARRQAVPSDASITWSVAPGEGPPPVTIPALFTGKKTVGGLAIEIDRIDAARLRFAVVPGTGETAGRNDAPAQPGATPLIAWGLGHRTRGTRTGLTIGEEVLVPMHRNYANMVLRDGKLTVLPPAEPQAERADTQIVQLPVLARDGSMSAEARELGGRRRRSALCLDDSGTLFVARMTHDTPAPLVQALLDLGCDLVLEMDRGSHPPPLVERAGTDLPPEAAAEQTRLYAHPGVMRPRTHLF